MGVLVGLVAHQELIHRGVIAGDQNYQLHPSLIGVVLGVVALQTVVDEADIQLGQGIDRHILKLHVGLSSHGNIGLKQTVHIDHVKLGTEGCRHNRICGILRVGDRIVLHADGIYAVQVIVSAVRQRLPKSHIIGADRHDHTDSGRAVGIKSDNGVPGRPVGIPRSDSGQECVGQVITALVCTGVSGVEEHVRNHVQVQSASLGEDILTIVQIAALHQLIHIALKALHTGSCQLVRSLGVNKDLGSTDRVTVLDHHVGIHVVAGILLDGSQNGAAHLSALHPEDGPAVGSPIPSLLRVGVLTEHFGNGLVLGHGSIHQRIVFIPLIEDFPGVLCTGSHILTSNIELADINGDRLDTGDRHHHIFGLDIVILTPDPSGPVGEAHLFQLIASLGAAGTHLTGTVVAESIQRTIVEDLIAALSLGNTLGQAHDGVTTAGGDHSGQIGVLLIIQKLGGYGLILTDQSTDLGMPQLTQIAITPSVDTLILRQSHTVVTTGRQSHHILVVLTESELHGNVIVLVLGVLTLTQLLLAILAPTDDTAIIKERQSVVVAVIDLNDLTAIEDGGLTAARGTLVNAAAAIGIGALCLIGIVVEVQCTLIEVGMADIAAPVGHGKAQLRHRRLGKELSTFLYPHLAIPVGAPTPEGAVVTNHMNRVVLTALRDINDLAQTGNTLRYGVSQGIGLTQTQLTKLVAAEGVHPAILGQDGHMEVTHDHLGDNGLLRTVTQAHQLRQVSIVTHTGVVHIPLAQLTLLIGTPDEEPAQVGAGSGVVFAGGHGSKVLAALQQIVAVLVHKLHLNGQGGIVAVAHAADIIGTGLGHAQLTVGVVTPGPDGAVVPQRHGMVTTGHDHVAHSGLMSRLGRSILGNNIDVVDDLLTLGLKDNVGIAICIALDFEGTLIVILGVDLDGGSHRLCDIRIDGSQGRITLADEVLKQVEPLAQHILGIRRTVHTDGNDMLAGGLALFAHNNGSITQSIVLLQRDTGIVTGAVNLTLGITHGTVGPAGIDGTNNGVRIMEICHVDGGRPDNVLRLQQTQTGLTLEVAAPSVQVAVLAQSHGVVVAGGDGHDGLDDIVTFVQQDRLGHSHVLPCASLAGGVVTPTVDKGAVCKGQAVTAAGRNGHKVVVACAGHVHIGGGGMHPGLTEADTHTVIGIVTGGIDGTRLGDEQGVALTGGNTGDTMQAHPGGFSHFIRVAQTQLAIAIIAPDPDITVSIQCQGEFIASGNRHDSGVHSLCIEDLNKTVDRAVDCVHTQLTPGVAAGSPDVAVHIHSQAVVHAGGHIHKADAVIAAHNANFSAQSAIGIEPEGLDLDRIVRAPMAAVHVLYQSTLVIVLADTKLSILVETVRPDGIVRPQSQSVTAAGNHLGGHLGFHILTNQICLGQIAVIINICSVVAVDLSVAEHVHLNVAQFQTILLTDPHIGGTRLTGLQSADLVGAVQIGFHTVGIQNTMGSAVTIASGHVPVAVIAVPAIGILPVPQGECMELGKGIIGAVVLQVQRTGLHQPHGSLIKDVLTVGVFHKDHVGRCVVVTIQTDMRVIVSIIKLIYTVNEHIGAIFGNIPALIVLDPVIPSHTGMVGVSGIIEHALAQDTLTGFIIDTVVLGHIDHQLGLTNQSKVVCIGSAAVGKLIVAVVTQSPHLTGIIHGEEILITGVDHLIRLTASDNTGSLEVLADGGPSTGNTCLGDLTKLTHRVITPGRHIVLILEDAGAFLCLHRYLTQRIGGVLAYSDIEDVAQISTAVTSHRQSLSVTHQNMDGLVIRGLDIFAVANAQLAVAVITHSPDCAVDIQCHHMGTAGGDLDNIQLTTYIIGCIGKASDRCCHRSTHSDLPHLARGSAEIVPCQLYSIIHLRNGLRGLIFFTVSVNQALSSGKTGCEQVGISLPHSDIGGQNHRRTSVVLHLGGYNGLQGIKADTQSVIGIAAECVCSAALSDNERYSIGGRNLCGRIKSIRIRGIPAGIADLADLLQGGTTQLTVSVLTPAPDSTVFLQRQDMVLARGNGGSRNHITGTNDHLDVGNHLTVHHDVYDTSAGLLAGQMVGAIHLKVGVGLVIVAAMPDGAAAHGQK